MIKLVKGKLDRLEGRVLTYSRFTGDIRETMSPEGRKEFEKAVEILGKEDLLKSRVACTFFGCSNPIEFVKKVKEYIELDDEAQETLDESKNEVGEGGLIPFFMAQLPILSEEDIMSSDGDVIYAGSYGHPLTCLNASVASLNLYRMKFSDQIIESVAKSREEKKAKEKIVIPEKIAYTQIPKQELPEFIYKNYIIQMMNAKRDNKGKEYKTLEDQFIFFGKGSHFQNDIVDLCKFLSSSSGDIKDTPIITATINKIQAINTENFEAAARYRDEINLLRQQRDKSK